MENGKAAGRPGNFSQYDMFPLPRKKLFEREIAENTSLEWGGNSIKRVTCPTVSVTGAG